MPIWLNDADEALKMRESLAEFRVPASLWDGLTNHILKGRPTDHFLEAVLCNDLRRACERADLQNRYKLFDIVSFLYNEAPAGCWGDLEKVELWHKLGGLHGMRAAIEHTVELRTATDDAIDLAARQQVKTIRDGWRERGLCTSCGHPPHDEPCLMLIHPEEQCGCMNIVLLG
jgi:hypothetical protein